MQLSQGAGNKFMTMGSAASSQGQKLRQARSSRAPHDWPLAPSSPSALSQTRTASHTSTSLKHPTAPYPQAAAGAKRPSTVPPAAVMGLAALGLAAAALAIGRRNKAN